jgi:hypothetical protein
MAAANERGVAMDYDKAREHVYCMPYGEWKDHHQLPATEAQIAAFKAVEQAKKLAKV